MRVGERLRELAGPERARQVLAGQLAFERLEWLGDSVLDVLALRAVCLSAPVEATAHEVAVQHSGLVSDRVLSRAAARFDLPSVQPAERRGRYDDPDSRHRLGDSVEAWIGASWLTEGWLAAIEAAVLVPLRGFDPLLLSDPAPAPSVALAEPPPSLQPVAAEHGWEPRDKAWLGLVVSPLPYRRRLVAAGAACVEQSAAAALLEKHPQRDEGWLTRERARVTSPDALTEIASDYLPHATGFSVNDRYLLALLGAVLLDAGPSVAELVTRRFLRL